MRRPIVALALAAAVLAACGDDSVTSGATDATTASTVEATSPAGTDGVGEPAVPQALDFSAPLVGGEQLDFSGYAGETVALWFWAPT